MRKSTIMLVLAMAVLFNLNSYAQRTCAAHDVMLEQWNKSPKVKEKAIELEKFTQNFLKSGVYKAAQTRTIPVYVHVIYKTSQENISDAQIQSQIDVLNIDYGGTNSDLSNVPTEFAGVKSMGTGIQFVLVGIDRKYVNKTSWGTDDDMKKSSKGGVDPVTPDTHMNMWICNIGGGILGYAQFPGGAASTDGVVFSPQYCGSSDYNDGSFYLSAPFDKGRTAVHEVGHYLNLRHIWGDGACSASDYVDDTPSASAANYNCPSHPHSTCGSNDMFMNYMDYVDDACMFMFSEGQSARMWATLNSTRANLGTSDDNVAPTAKANGPYADDPGNAISFSSAGSVDTDGSIANYSWNFGDGATSTQANPTHTYATAGLYNVSLTVTDDKGATDVENTTATIGTVCSGVQACDGNITFNLTTDKYGSETTWTLKNSAGTTVESGSGYGNNTTYNLNWTLEQDTYTFTIKDSYGDGICCSYGNGTYNIVDGCNTTIMTMTNFKTEESVTFCVPEGTTVPNVDPTAEANGPYAADETVVINFSSNGSNDTDGTIDTYSWNFGDGASSTSANPSHAYATAGTYTATLTVTDDKGATATDQATVTITEAPVVVVDYCTSKGNNSSYEWIDLVKLGTINNVSGNDGGYNDNTNMTTNLPIGTNTINFSAGFKSSSYTEYWQVWIDLNQDGDFTDSGEKLVSGSSSSSNSLSATLEVPATAKLGQTRMRVTMKYNAAATSCESFSYGEVEDYTVNIVAAGARLDGSQDAEELGFEESVMFSVYPNPVEDMLTISLPENGTAVVKIIDMSGKTIKTVKKENRGSINVEDLATGMYIIKAQTGVKEFTEKFYKN